MNRKNSYKRCLNQIERLMANQDRSHHWAERLRRGLFMLSNEFPKSFPKAMEAILKKNEHYPVETKGRKETKSPSSL